MLSEVARDPQAEPDALATITRAAVEHVGGGEPAGERRDHHGRADRAHLRAALGARGVIGMAKGILVEWHDIDAERAFSMLVHASQHANRKLREVAEWLVGHRGERPDGRPPAKKRLLTGRRAGLAPTRGTGRA
ncbi:ANTAR domain-containing protein [Amycolatopsis sp. NPDC005961]|uniref:ANTAR domain-containing protein n=1 Tax=Amycolatopsis sp. NPDC005961 TaxID=3156720 RepID=UPI0033D49EB6